MFHVNLDWCDGSTDWNCFDHMPHAIWLALWWWSMRCDFCSWMFLFLTWSIAVWLFKMNKQLMLCSELFKWYLPKHSETSKHKCYRYIQIQTQFKMMVQVKLKCKYKSKNTNKSKTNTNANANTNKNQISNKNAMQKLISKCE